MHGRWHFHLQELLRTVRTTFINLSCSGNCHHCWTSKCKMLIPRKHRTSLTMWNCTMNHLQKCHWIRCSKHLEHDTYVRSIIIFIIRSWRQCQWSFTTNHFCLSYVSRTSAVSVRKSCAISNFHVKCKVVDISSCEDPIHIATEILAFVHTNTMSIARFHVFSITHQW